MKKIFLTCMVLATIFAYSSENTILYRNYANGKLKEIVFNPKYVLINANKNTKISPERVLKNFIEKQKLGIDLKNFELKSKLSNTNTTTLRYTQKANNLPVFNSELLCVIYKDKVVKLVNNTFSDFNKPDFKNIEKIKEKIKIKPKFKKIVSVEKGYFGKKPCFRIKAVFEKDLKYIYVDAKNGQILKEKSLIVHFDSQGQIFYPNPVCYSGNTQLADNNDSDYTELNQTYVTVTLTDISSSGKLKNRFVDLTAHGIAPASYFGYYPVSEYSPGLATENNGGYFYLRSDYAFEEVNAYYWITEARKYIESMGIGILPNPIPVNVHYMRADNSFYSETDKGLHFGDGGVDDAEDGEIILHEFMHAVTHYIIPGMGNSWEAASLDEGLSDYFAASFGNDKIFRDYIGEWDATTYHPGTPAYIRPIKTDRHYPENMKEPYYLTGQANIHWDGVIFSSTLWQIRKAVGNEFDKDVIEALYHISTSTSYQSAALSFYSADAFNGGKFQETISYFFYKRGILPENYTVFVPEKEGKKLFFPYAPNNNKYQSFLGLINLSNQQATIYIDYIAKEGMLVLREKEIVLNPGEKYYSEVNGDEIDTDFWIMATSDQKIEGYIYTVDKEKSKSRIFKGIEKLSNTVYVPHIAPETDYWNSFCALANGKNVNTSVNIDIHQGEETTIPSPSNPYTMNYFEWYRDFYNPNGITPEKNWATINSDSENLACYQIFERKDVNQTCGLSLDLIPSNTLYFPHIHVEGNYWWTGIVFENTSDNPSQITVFAYDEDGNTLDTFSLNLDAYQKTVCLVQDLWINNGRDFPQNTAWIKITGEENNLIGYQLFGTLPEMGARLLSGINAITVPSTKLLFPHIQSGENFWTGIAVINSSQNESTITFTAYDNQGNMLEEVEKEGIKPNQKTVFLVKDIFSPETVSEIAYIIAKSENKLCGFEIGGNSTAEENGEIVERQDYIAGMEGISLDR